MNIQKVITRHLEAFDPTARFSEMLELGTREWIMETFDDDGITAYAANSSKVKLMGALLTIIHIICEDWDEAKAMNSLYDQGRLSLSSSASASSSSSPFNPVLSPSDFERMMGFPPRS